MDPRGNISDFPVSDASQKTNRYRNVIDRMKRMFQSPLALKMRGFVLHHKLAFGLSFVILLLGFVAVLTTPRQSDRMSRLTTNDEDGFEKLVLPADETPFFTLTTKETRKFGILPQDTFVLSAVSPITLETVRSILNASQTLNVKEISDKEFELTNASLLALNEPIEISLNTKDKEIGGRILARDYGWSFQTQEKFRVVTSIPGNEKTSVPINTGIEIVFSQDGFKDPARLVSIEPSVEFETRITDETFSIIPQQKLLPETVYTVTLRRGTTLVDRDDQIDSDYTFSFQTQSRPEMQFSSQKDSIQNLNLFVNDTFLQVSPDEALSIKVSNTRVSAGYGVDAVVYKFAGPADFVETRKDYEDNNNYWGSYYPSAHKYSEGLAEVSRSHLAVQTQDNVRYLQLLQPFEPGYYLIEFQREGELVSDQIWYQSSELSSYVSLGKEQTIVWANNTADHRPSSGTRVVDVTSGGSWLTNDEGVAKFPTPQSSFDTKYHFFELTDQAGNSLVVPSGRHREEEGPASTSRFDYWSYLYTEKLYYSSNDTVNFWGLIKNRDTNGIPASKIVLVNNQTETVYSQVLTPSSDGTFLGKVELKDVANGWYGLRLMVGDVEVEELSFSVQEYEKPDMKIEVSSDKKAIFVDEEAKFTTTTSFFDGTPGAHINLTINETPYGNSKRVETDDNGSASYTYKPNEKSIYNYPSYGGVSVIPALAQGSIIEGNASVMVYGPRVMISSQSTQDSGKGTIEATLNSVDLTGINNGTNNDPKGGTLARQSVNLVVTEYWTIRRQEGTYYNFVEKTTSPRYRYERQSEKVVDSKLLTGSDGKLSYSFDMKDGRSYEAVLTSTDSKGRSATKKHYLYTSRWSDSSYQASDDTIYIDLDGNNETNMFSVGEEVKVILTQNESPYEASSDERFLFTRAKRGSQDIIVTGDPRLTFTFDANHIPTLYVDAVVFTGRNYKQVQSVCRNGWGCDGYSYYWYGYNTFSGIQINYQKTDSEAAFEILPSKTSYAPGEEARIDVKVVKGESPLSGMTVNLAMIDEALVAISGSREPTIVKNIYESVPHEIYFVYTSHNPLFPDVPGAEKGGGGGDRTVFKDTALFDSAVTDSEGVAHFVFTLPDNITTWVTYAQGVNGSMDVGQAETRIVVTKDFFVTSKFPRTYLKGDSVEASLNSFGSALSVSDSVAYALIVSADTKALLEYDKNALVFTEVGLPIPDLDEGEYTITARGNAVGKEDGIALPLTVVNSRVKQAYSDSYSVKESESLSDPLKDKYLKDEPVGLIISDKGKGMFFSQLLEYCFSSQSNRLEKRLSAIHSNRLLLNSFDYSECKRSLDGLDLFQGEDGGLSQVVWGGSDLSTSLWSTIVSADSFDTDSLNTYFEDQFNSANRTTIEKIESAWGASLTGESKLKYLQSMKTKVFSFDEKVTLALALSSLGDTEAARTAYFDLLSQYGYTRDEYIRLDSKLNLGNTEEKYILDTSFGLMLGGEVEPKYTDKLYNYVNDFRADVINYVIDLSDISYIDNQIATLPDEDTVYSLTTSSGTETNTLKNGKSIAYDLTVRDLDAFSYTLQSGKSELLFNYSLGIQELDTKSANKYLGISREYEKVGGSEGNEIRTGDIVRVTLNLHLDTKYSPKGGYSVTDIIPSGFSYISNPSSLGYSGSYFSRNVDAKVARFTLYHSPYRFKNGDTEIVYYARASAKGTYKAEPAIFQSRNDLTVFTKTENDFVTIQ